MQRLFHIVFEPVERVAPMVVKLIARVTAVEMVPADGADFVLETRAAPRVAAQTFFIM